MTEEIRNEQKINLSYAVREIEDFEFLNPIDWIKSTIMGSSLMHDENYIKAHGLPITEYAKSELLKLAEAYYEKQILELKAVPVPEFLIKLLEAKKKSEQEKLLKNVTITSDEFRAFLIYAGEKHGYTLSQYKESYDPDGFEGIQKPIITIKEDDGSITKVGETILTDGQLKNLIDHRRVTVSKFIDNGDRWHCFFFTYKSIGGKENYNDGQPHIHYISNYWTITREYVVEQMKSKYYNLSSLPHINFIR